MIQSHASHCTLTSFNVLLPFKMTLPLSYIKKYRMSFSAWYYYFRQKCYYIARATSLTTCYHTGASKAQRVAFLDNYAQLPIIYDAWFRAGCRSGITIWADCHTFNLLCHFEHFAKRQYKIRHAFDIMNILITVFLTLLDYYRATAYLLYTRRVSLPGFSLDSLSRQRRVLLEKAGHQTVNTHCLIHEATILLYQPL